MKHIYLLIILLFSYNLSSAQDGNLEGTWYLTSIEVNNVVYPNYYNDTSFFEVDFSSLPNQDFFSFFGSGSCESFGGACNFDESEITINELNLTLGGSCSNIIPADQYQDLYFGQVIDSGQEVPFSFTYTITTQGDNNLLTITNTSNGNVANYNNVQGTQRLMGTWYLSRIEIPGSEPIVIPDNDQPSLTLTNTIDPTFNELIADGEGDCNGFFSNYLVSLTNGNNIQLSNFTQTLADCTSNYELQYFSILGDNSTNFSDFEIINNGDTLIFIDLLGARLIFNDAPLSIKDNDFNLSKIALNENPVSNSLELSTSQNIIGSNYEIFSRTGQRIVTGKLNSNSINVNQLHSGLYFLKVSTNENIFETVKFIKD